MPGKAEIELDKLQSKRQGYRKSIQTRIEEIEASKTEMNLVRLTTLLRTVEEKQQCLKQLDESILDLTKMEDIEEEIVSSEDFMSDISVRVKEYEDFLTTSRMAESASSVRFIHSAGEARDQFSTRESNMSTNHIQQTVSSVSSNSSQFQRLPKLTLPTFSGELLEWQTFWDSFETTIHLNTQLSNVQKFNYLKSLLEGEAARCIEGFALTNSNYTQALEVLRERFGQRHKIIQSYMNALMELPKPSYSVYSLRSYYDSLETYIRGLDSLGHDQESYGTLLVPVILNRLPAEIRKCLARVNITENWILSDLRVALKNEIAIMEVGGPRNQL